jgi:hypothetical protein
MRRSAIFALMGLLFLSACGSILPSPTELVANRGKSAFYIGMYRTGFESFFDEKTEVAILSFQRLGVPSSFFGLERIEVGTRAPNQPGFKVVEPGTYQLTSIEFGPGGPLTQQVSFPMGKHPRLAFSIGPGEVLFLGSFEVHVARGGRHMELRNQSALQTDYGVIQSRLPGLYERIRYDPLNPEPRYALDIRRIP